ncbi:hypothetical protein EC3431_0743 [Escherichia coli 3431]|nr:hypothetical protein EC3431_0743 [Escherichia coli 3431]
MCGLTDMKQSSPKGGSGRKLYSTTPAKSGQSEEIAGQTAH